LHTQLQGLDPRPQFHNQEWCHHVAMGRLSGNTGWKARDRGWRHHGESAA
jgi:hypothetical protein